ncbi:hypothetical protein L249_7844 [Ophiocordyceps polyrhachis-furcata BCC 54312]|uniref:Uncharacterized protein n=1 Tax=Ophiocordyceps polyrhachis-furcata BCC 54312 TaxID=1330021 RepID=A0A367L0U3_9HYPO|nr:hypothetical protein L249_7844 [Ophiocordyceps polyrhachis-furcata BCC 54312]
MALISYWDEEQDPPSYICEDVVMLGPVEPGPANRDTGFSQNIRVPSNQQLGLCQLYMLPWYLLPSPSLSSSTLDEEPFK